jgi:signal transduction histidine kinase/ActR/RegA family two-component response regulator
VDAPQTARQQASYAAAFDTRLLETQLALVCRLSPAALRSGLGAGALIAWLVSSDSSIPTVVAWLALLTAASIGRLWLQAYYMRHAAQLDVRRWIKFALGGLALNGLVWAIPCIWLVPSDPARQTVLAILSIGIAATAVASLAPLRHAYLTLLLPFMLPIAASYTLLDDNFRLVALGIVLFVIAMLRIARRQHDAMHELLQLQLDLQAQIAQREQTEAALRIAKADAEAANRAKSQFLANMSHELRTPLNGVLGMSELLIRETTGKPLKHAQTVRSAGMRLLRIISDILDLSRMEAGALSMSPSDFAPRAMTSEVVELLLEHATRKGLALTATVDASVPQRVSNDAGRIQQVLSNLVDNAIKFTTHGSVAIVATARAEAAHSDRPERSIVRWEVRDTGIGIPVDAQVRLFKPFSQLDESATRKFGGAGLGLAISRQLVEALGGAIGILSSPNAGATFWFEVPCDVVTMKQGPTYVTSLIATTRRAGHVLVVEDNPINRELAAEMLQAAGCTVTTANDGEQALACIRTTRFDLVLMDWHMPIMDGLTAARLRREIEAAQNLSRLPIVALTASVLPGDREACTAAGMDGFVAKPFSHDDLIALLERWLPVVPATSHQSDSTPNA